MGRIILVDASGSMAEEGKKSVVRYLLYAVEGILNANWPNASCEIYLWNNTISEFDTKIEFGGKSSAKVLKAFLETHYDSSILFITDGSYTEEIKSVLKNTNNAVMALLVGSDCNKARLQRIFGNENLYETTDVATCIERFMCDV